VVGEGGEGAVEEDGLRISASSLLRSQLSCAIGFDADEEMKQNPSLSNQIRRKCAQEMGGIRAGKGKKMLAQNRGNECYSLTESVTENPGERRMRSGDERIWVEKSGAFLLDDQVSSKPWKWIEDSAGASPSRKILRCRFAREAESHEANQIRRRN